jgi:hypothetical protein
MSALGMDYATRVHAHEAQRLALCPVSLAQANAFVARHHRRLGPVRGHKFSIGAVLAGALVGVVIVGRPNARGNQDGFTLEVTRLATDGVDRTTLDRRGKRHTMPVCSFLYGAARRATFALGYRRLGTYIAKDEPGITMAAVRWRSVGEVKGRSWDIPRDGDQTNTPSKIG